jgi:hypothetical protein
LARLSAVGLTIDTPAGWDARIFRRPAQGAETTHAVLHAANFALPAGAGDYGDGAVQLMGPSSALVVLVEFHPTSTSTALFAAQGLPLPLHADDASRSTLQHAMGGQAGIQRFFSLAGRAWCLYAVLGSFDLRRQLVPLVNAVVAAIEVAPA